MVVWRRAERGRARARLPVRVLARVGAAAGLAAALAVTASTAAAGNSTTTFAVTAFVSPLCTIAATNLSFGAYDPLLANAAAALDATATVSVACTMGTAGRVILNAGDHSSDGVRAMAMGSAYLHYQIYVDPGRIEAWPPRGGTTVVGKGLTRPPQRLTLYGRIFPGQVVPAGRYSDTVRATVDF